MGRVTVSRPPDPPMTRRDAKAMRDAAQRHAPAVVPTSIEPPTSTVPLPIVAVGDTAAVAGPVIPVTRRAARAAELLAVDIPPVQHARPRRALRAAVSIGLAAAGALLLGSTAAMTAMISETPGAPSADDRAAAVVRVEAPPPRPVAALPVPHVEQAQPTQDICTLPEVVEALGSGDDEGAIAAAGGGEAFRVAVVEGNAPCISLSDPARVWVVVNKTRPYDPIDYRPATLVHADDVRAVAGGSLRPDAASALTHMVAAAQAAGVGELALDSGFRSHSTQVSSYGRQVADRGVAGADLVSARPGFSEHQSGLAADVVPCTGGCGSLDALAGSPQGAWLAEHAWEFGWIARYEEGHTATTGYSGEPWHIRFIGHELARAYHQGGWHSMEAFFALPPAPAYVE
jgi:D-alanyl-D-alanine carboxypeptidase